MSIYRDRREAGRALATVLRKYKNEPDLMVLALPRGGVPVGYEVARALRAPLDVFVVRKLGVPGQEEYAMGALASGGASVLNRRLIATLRISDDDVAGVVAQERRELARRERLYRGDLPPLDAKNRSVLLVDDGLATGSTMRAAIAGLKQLLPRRIIVGVPIAPPDACEQLAREAGDVVCAATPQPFHAVSLWYDDFSQTSDEEVHELLRDARRHDGEPLPRSA
jgi:putative phosphoribosyl transferase